MSEPQTIVPGHLPLYIYSHEDDINRARITLQIPEGVNPNDLSFDLRNENKQIVCRLNDEPPFIAGELFDAVTGLEKQELEDGLLLVILTKSEPKMWERLITAPLDNKPFNELYPEFIKGNYFIDPFSATKLGFDHSTDDAQYLYLLKYASALGFTTAMIILSEYSCSQNDYYEAEKLLKIAANKYNDPEAIFRLAIHSIQNKKFDDAEKFFKRAIELHHINALVGLGELYSTLEQDAAFPRKNDELAVKLFRQALDLNPKHPFANYNLAKHYSFGKGVEQDKEKAEHLYNISLQVDKENIASLPNPLTEPLVSSTNYGLIIGVTAALCFAGLFAFSYFFKKSKK